MKSMRVAHTPDADDAFMFYGMLFKSRKAFEHVVADIETLNRKAFRGEYDVTALSAHAYAFVHEKYRILSAGASVGEGYGPVLVAKRSEAADMREAIQREQQREQRETATGRRMVVAVPGKYTTAALLLRLALPDCEAVEMRFDEIADAVLRGSVNAGVLIHEAQLTYEQRGLEKVLDFWEWWHSLTGLPLPLGLNAIKRSIPEDAAREFLEAMKESVKYALEHVEEALKYAMRYARGADESIIKRFTLMYVNESTYEMPESVVKALEMLYEMGEQQGLFKKPPLDILY